MLDTEEVNYPEELQDEVVHFEQDDVDLEGFLQDDVGHMDVVHQEDGKDEQTLNSTDILDNIPRNIKLQQSVSNTGNQFILLDYYFFYDSLSFSKI